ncbi:hypothetical protein WDZ92_25930, partial [Nostoc sp. NIES-2111]
MNGEALEVWAVRIVAQQDLQLGEGFGRFAGAQEGLEEIEARGVLSGVLAKGFAPERDGGGEVLGFGFGDAEVDVGGGQGQGAFVVGLGGGRGEELGKLEIQVRVAGIGGEGAA